MSITGTESGLGTVTEDFLQVCDGCWPTGQPRAQVVARAPGRVDCIGGMADFSGALALQMPLECAAHVAMSRRADQRISVQSIGRDPSRQNGHALVAEWPIAYFYESDGQFTTGRQLREKLADRQWVWPIAGVFLALLESSDVQHFAGGVTVVLQSDIPVAAGLASSAAIQVAVARGLAASFNANLTPADICRACRTAAVEVGDALPGMVDHATCLLGEADALLQVRCQPDEVLGTLTLPDDLTIGVVDSGTRLPIYRDRYLQNRDASLIGRFFIERLSRQSSPADEFNCGYLANISPQEYVTRFRNHLPVKLRGRDFLEAFGQPDGLDIEVQAGAIYKVRSRAEHHIYENDRAHRFLERLSRVRRTGERDALVEAGELMYASHWSYGQRCGMGSIETDVLVNLIREKGAARGLFGAKVTAGGCGGAVAVLMTRIGASEESLREACAAYAEKTGKHPTILLGSSPGAIHFNPQLVH